MSYNLLAQSSIRRDHYQWCSEKALKWAYRKKLIYEELSSSKCDIICVQECDNHFYQQYWKEAMAKIGYGSEFKAKDTKAANHGCAIFYKRDA
jgi:CCR4-NOT transcription complex subunit 6